MNTSRNVARYKNEGLDGNEMRRRREEESNQLRKQKREQQFAKRRNLNTSVDVADDRQPHMEGEIRPELVQLLYSSNVYEQLTAMRKFRQILSEEPNPPIEEVISTG